MLTLPAKQLNALSNEKILIPKSPTISKEFVPTGTYFFFKLCSRLSAIDFFRTFQIRLATPCR